MSKRICSSVVLLKNRLGSPTSYVSAVPRGPKLISFSIGSMKVHASKQLPGRMPVPSLSLHFICQSLGRGGKLSTGLKGLDTVEMLDVEIFVLFRDCHGSLDGG